MVRLHDVVTSRAGSLRQACDPALLSRVDAVVICDPDWSECGCPAYGEMELLADALVAHRLMGIVLSPGTAGVVPGEGDALMTVPAAVSVDELWGRVATIRQYRPLLLQMEQQVTTMQRLGKKLNQHFTEVDQELRLASRLQRDFLPRSFPEVGEIRFAALYRPATWVSGDVYDIRRLDEARLGCYVADAVGHGVAAGLLTMFIKQALVGKRVDQGEYNVFAPEEVLATLNTALVEQELPNYQFATACYCLIDTSTNELTFSRAGHPHPIHITANGECTEIHTVGGLLGVFSDEDFPSATVPLQRGEKLILYSDGLEDALMAGRDRAGSKVTFTPEFLQRATLPGPSMIDSLAAQLDRCEGSLQPCDDQTCLVIERVSR
jgi:sigma-B regulation protein RsbU (phosphoserine phosphatase)